MPGPYARLRALRRLLISDVDGTLLDGGKAGRGCAALGERLERVQAGLVLATGRDLALTLEAVDELESAGLPRPDALICSVGSELYLGGDNTPDESWARHIGEGWDRDAVVAALGAVEGLTPQGEDAQKAYKVSYFFEEGPHRGRESGGARSATGPAATASSGQQVTAAAASALSAAGLRARLIASAGRFLDVLPERASKGAAARWLLSLAAFDPRGVIVAGDSGNDRELLLTEHSGQPLAAVIVGNHEPELADLAAHPNVYVAKGVVCAGVLEGLTAHGW